MKFFSKLLTSLILCLLMTHSDETQAQSDAPFLYYYSEAQGAFIVERADGSDRRILANYQISPSEPNQEAKPIIVGPGWSPSGQWFAWWETINYGGISTIAHVVDKDGHTISILKDDYVALMDWSPTDDKLLMMLRAGGDTYNVFIVDPQNPNHPVQIHDALQYNASPIDYINWTPDGRYVVQYSMDKLGDSKMEVVTVDGAITMRDFYRPEINCGIPAWSSDGRVAYTMPDRSALALENPLTGETSRLQLPSENIRYMLWSPDGSALLVFTSADCSNRLLPQDLWLVSNQAVTFIAHDVQPPYNTSSYPIVDYWSQDSHYAFFRSSDKLFVLDAILQSTILASEMNGFNPVWLQPTNLAFVDSAQYTLEIFDPIRQIIAPLLPKSVHPVYQFALSANAKYLAYSGLGFFIANLQDQQTVEVDVSRAIPGETNYSGNGYVREIRWHPSDDWVIVETGDHYGPVYVSNADGSIQRALTVCASVLSCSGWMPET